MEPNNTFRTHDSNQIQPSEEEIGSYSTFASKLVNENKEEQIYTCQNISLLHEIFFVLIVMSGQLVTQIGVSQGLSSIQIVGQWFEVEDQGELGWSIASYSLTSGAFIVIAGRLGDIFGHRNMFCFGFAWLALWSLLTGISSYSNAICFYCCRGFQGIGSAFLLPNGLAILGHAYPPGKRKTLAFAAFGACTPLGFVLGGTTAAIFSQLAKWTWSYWSMAIACFFLVVVSMLIIPKAEIEDEKGTIDFDYFGAFTGVAGLTLFNIAWNQAPIIGWQRAYVYILLILGVLLLIAFVFIELKVSQPLIPLRLMSTSIIRVLICVGCGFGTFGIWVYYFWNFLLLVRGNDPLTCAAQFSPVAVAGVCAAGFTGTHLQKVSLLKY